MTENSSPMPNSMRAEPIVANTPTSEGSVIIMVPKCTPKNSMPASGE